MMGIALGASTATAIAEPAGRLDPDTARWVSLGVTVAGLGAGAYLWHRAGALEDGGGRAETQLQGLAVGTLALSVGPMTGLLLGGERRRAIGGALARPGLLVGGGLAAITGFMVLGFGCFETDDCGAAKVAGGTMIGLGALAGGAAIAWAAYDIYDTPRVLRRRRTSLQLAPIVHPTQLGLAVTLVR